MLYVPKGKRPVLPHPFDKTLALVQLTKGYQAVISAIDAGWVGRFNWSALPVKSGLVYAIRRVRRKGILLHRAVAEAAGIDLSHEVDHRDGNSLNCARFNLRAATSSQNSANQKVSAASSSGIRGVRWIEKRKKWMARVHRGDKTTHVGYFDTKESAAQAASAARKALFGEFGNRENPQA